MVRIYGIIAVALAIPALAEPEALGLALEQYPYPHPVAYIQLEVQRQPLRMAYMDINPENANGETVVLLHGKNFCGAYWANVIDTLAAEGYRVVVPDQIGFGKSSKPGSLQYSFQMLAENTKQLLDRVGVSNAAILGHSMGGMLATRFALMYPHMTRALILANPIGLEDWKVHVPYQTVDAWYEQELNKTEDEIRNYQKQNYYHGEWKPEYEPWVQILYRWTLSPEYPRLAWVNALTYDMIFTQPVVYEFPKLTMPTLLIIGQLDRTALGKNLVPDDVAKTMGDYPALGKAAAAAIPGATLVELEGVGHIPHLESPQAFFDALLQFLRSEG